MRVNEGRRVTEAEVRLAANWLDWCTTPTPRPTDGLKS